jgi:hypothetical protein
MPGEGGNVVALEVAGLVLVFALGLLISPSYLDFGSMGAWLRRTLFAFRQSPGYPVGLVLGLLCLIPVGQLVVRLMAHGGGGELVVAYLAVFVVGALAGALWTPPASYLGLSTPRPRTADEEGGLGEIFDR